MNPTKDICRTLIPPALIVIGVLSAGWFPEVTLGYLAALAWFICGSYIIIDILFMKGVSLMKTPLGVQVWTKMKSDAILEDKRNLMVVLAALLAIVVWFPIMDVMVLYLTLTLVYSSARHWVYLSSTYDEEMRAL